MRIAGRHYRTIALAADGCSVEIIDQTLLPFTFKLRRLQSLEDAAQAICEMTVRGAPLIGVTAAYGVALAMRTDPGNASLRRAMTTLGATRPTAVNLHWALARMSETLQPLAPGARAAQAYAEAWAIAEEDVRCCEMIGRHGLKLLQALAARSPGRRLNVLTHCNAGWLACVDWGTALAPIYAAHEDGLPVHVYVDETRPRNQGAALTAFELGAHGIPYTLIVDNAGGHLMQQGQIDVCLVGSDRATAGGDIANKIGTYLKALAARDNDVPFYVALPFSSIDWSINDGLAQIPIENRPAREVTHLAGLDERGRRIEVRIAPTDATAANPAFDVTPARLITGIITERGVAAADYAGLAALYPERSEARRAGA
ncbi:methylthioribose-1-phosphate isomerase [Steroidobacter denitrificans]|uniref:Methylthioribose-1-phosphate isomerase n=1 Tax=Steroidobacter denitrificans TaxID=465721 RepID=A0A127F9S9_STEDE|nr:S-methyl-5-thioribose-1-phosphate isomerase [Steroidobacter denitrificans]AMN47172.1 methylthioribose-1-phosphate isomerase [Steroidobacter denitrificans]